jgi:hypothetical protein
MVNLLPTDREQARQKPIAGLYLAAAIASWYSARALSPPLLRQSLTSPSRSLSYDRPTTMSETPSFIVWSSSACCAEYVGE